MIEDENGDSAEDTGKNLLGRQCSQNGFERRNTNGLHSNKRPLVILVLLLGGIFLPLLRVVIYAEKPGTFFLFFFSVFRI